MGLKGTSRDYHRDHSLLRTREKRGGGSVFEGSLLKETAGGECRVHRASIRLL